MTTAHVVHLSRPGRRPRGLPFAILVAAVALALLATLFAGTASTAAATPLRISVYGDIGNPVGSGNPLLVHPSRFLLAEDGSSALVGLHWTGWGTSVARAHGYSHASECTPSCATGLAWWRPATLTLSSPGKVLGHEVYRCFRVTVPSIPKTGPYGCIGRLGSLYAYHVQWGPPILVPMAAQFSWPVDHVVGTPLDGVVMCDVSATLVSCWSTPPAAPNGETVSLASTGPAAICTMPECGSAVADMDAPRLPVGSRVTDGPFRCTSTAAGVVCVVTRTGIGFQMDATSATLVGS